MSPRITKTSLRREHSSSTVSNQESQLVRRSARLAKRATWQRYASRTQSDSSPARAKIHTNTITAPFNIATFVKPNNSRRSQPPALPFIIDSTADSTSSSSSSSSSSSEYPDSDIELATQDDQCTPFPPPHTPSLTRATRHKRSTSSNSTYASSNESYELDGFVVSDNHTDDIDYGYDADESAADEIQRKSSICSTSSENTLFVPEVKVKKKKLLHEHLPFRNKQLGTTSSEDVAEQISDAILLFSRRCNRGRKAMGVRVTDGDMRDREVREGLERAGKLGLVEKKEVKVGCVVWYFGAQGDKSVM